MLSRLSSQIAPSLSLKLFKTPIKSVYTTYTSESQDLASISYQNGIPCFLIPLPSRKERCVFSVKPLQHTVGDLTSFIKDEDRGIDRIVFIGLDGVRYAKSNQIQSLLNAGTFKIIINDQEFNIDTSNLDIPKPASVSSEVNSARAMVARFHSTLNADEHLVEMEQELQRQIEDIQEKLLPLEKQREELSQAAARRTRQLTWFGLGAMGIQFGILARLTWWEYSWDIMEPVTYFVGYGTSIAMYAYYVVTRQEYAFPSVFDRQYLKRFYQIARKKSFDVDQYNKLCDELAVCESDLRRLRDPLLYQLPLQQTHQLPHDILDKETKRKYELESS